MKSPHVLHEKGQWRNQGKKTPSAQVAPGMYLSPSTLFPSLGRTTGPSPCSHSQRARVLMVLGATDPALAPLWWGIGGCPVGWHRGLWHVKMGQVLRLQMGAESIGKTQSRASPGLQRATQSREPTCPVLRCLAAPSAPPLP